jgi:O-antigen/teichoic acid export membrane protein
MQPIKEKLLSVARGGGGGAAAVLQSLLSKLLVIAINVVTGIITARLLAPEGRGALAALILWPLFLANALTLGVPSALVFNLKRRPARASRLVGGALILGCLLSVAAVVVGVLLLPYWLRHYSPAVLQQAQFLLWYTPVCIFILIGRAAFEARSNFRGSNATLLGSTLLGVLGLIGLAITNTMTPFRAALAYTLSSVPVMVWVLYRLWREFQPRWQRLGTAIRALLHYGLRSYGADLLNNLSVQIDQVLVVGLLSPAAMGTYVVAVSLSRMLLLFQQAIVMVLFPKVAARPAEEVLKLTGRAARASALMTTVVGVAVMLAGQWLLRLLYGAEFVAAANLLRLLTLEVVLTSTTLVLAQAFMALGRPGVVTILHGVTLMISVPLLLLLVPRFGLLGAGIALVCASGTRLGVMLFSFPWLLKESMPNLLPGREDWLLLRQQLAKA